MATKDIDKEISVAPTLRPLVRATNSYTGLTVDLLGYSQSAFVVNIGTLTDSTHTFDPEESDDGSSWTNIAAGDLSGSFIVASSTLDDTVYEVGYLGSKRFVRVNVVVATATASGGVAVNVLRTGARRRPV